MPLTADEQWVLGELRAIAEAMRWDMVARNVASLARVPGRKAPRRALRVPGPETVRSLIASAPADLGDVIAVAAVLGLRRACGRRRDDDESAAGHLRRAVGDRPKAEREGAARHRVAPRGQQRRRCVPMDDLGQRRASPEPHRRAGVSSRTQRGVVVTAKPRTSPAAEDAPVGGRRPGVPVFRLLGRAPQASTERSIR